jgi:hypothetical protein
MSISNVLWSIGDRRGWKERRGEKVKRRRGEKKTKDKSKKIKVY